MEQAGEVVDYVVRGGLAVFLLLVIVGGAREWWVFGWTFRAVKAERDDWKRQADELLTISVAKALNEHDGTQSMDRRHG